MLLSNMLPNRGYGDGDGSAYAVDHAGLRTLLGTRRIIAANGASLAPFGTIDTPGQGETVSGVDRELRVGADAGPHLIPIDGSTIDVYVDNIFMGHPDVWPLPRRHRDAVPGPGQLERRGGPFLIDTTQLTNGLHTISWVVRDNAGRSAGMGSRFFRVQNGS